MLTLPPAVLVFLGGGIGAVLRYAVVRGTSAWFAQSPFPWSILLINLSGSFLLGLCLGCTSPGEKAPLWWPLVATGILGGYTTFSTFSADTLVLLQQQRLGAALANSIGSTLLGVACAFLGWWLANRLRA